MRKCPIVGIHDGLWRSAHLIHLLTKRKRKVSKEILIITNIVPLFSCRDFKYSNKYYYQQYVKAFFLHHLHLPLKPLCFCAGVAIYGYDRTSKKLTQSLSSRYAPEWHIFFHDKVLSKNHARQVLRQSILHIGITIWKKR